MRRSNPESLRGDNLDCFAALAMTCGEQCGECRHPRVVDRRGSRVPLKHYPPSPLLPSRRRPGPIPRGLSIACSAVRKTAPHILRTML
ncbi:hypothetical protein XH89_00100 [Bradyrhizobium sp. CCBAU 53340]|nr:hypothetical protein XH89_00100 [Bradyrhizobium sp. CCBAU 53340]